MKPYGEENWKYEEEKRKLNGCENGLLQKLKEMKAVFICISKAVRENEENNRNKHRKPAESPLLILQAGEEETSKKATASVSW